MKFLVDNQLPIAVARWLCLQGVDAVHVLDLGLSEKNDVYLWQFASRQGWIVISKDEDFFILANRPHDTGRLLWWRMGNSRKVALIQALGAAWPGISTAFTHGERIVELR